MPRGRALQAGRRRSQRRGQIPAGLGVAVLDAFGKRHGAQRFSASGVVRRRDTTGPAVLGQHQRAGIVAFSGTLEHHRHPDPPAVRDRDDVAAAQRGQRVVGGLPALQPRRARLRPLARGDLCAEPHVIQDRRVGAAELGGQVGQHALAALQPADHRHHRPIGLVLRERPLQQLVGLLGAHLVHQVDRHVVSGGEAAAQRERACRGQPGDLGGVGGAVVGIPQHDRVSLDVDAAAAGPTGQLGVLPRCQRQMLFAVVLHQPLEHDRAGGHVDAQRQRLGGEHRLHQAGGEQFLDRVAERRQHPGVVRGQAAQQAFAPLVEIEHHQVGVVEVCGAAIDDFGDPGALVVGGQPQRRPQALLDRGVAAHPGEDERDGRQQTGLVEHPDHLGTTRHPVQPGSPRSPTSAGLPVGQPFGFAAVGDVAQQLGIDQQVTPALRGGGGAVVEQVEQASPDHHVLPQRHRAVLVDDDGGVSAHRLDPSAELLGVADRRRQADQAHVVGQVQDDLLPHRTAHAVRQEVHLVHHHVGKPLQRRGIGVEHVAQDFGGHHHDVGVTVDGLIPGE